MGDSKHAILSTLIYSSLFDFPLSEDELYYYLHTNRRFSRSEFKKALSALGEVIVYQKGYYALIDKSTCIQNRIARREDNAYKLTLARSVANILSRIPTVLFIGISGSLAVGNAKNEDDIDFFMITQKHTLFTTRLLVLLALSFLGKRRKRAETHAKNKICLNMLVSENAVLFPKSKQDLFTAREIAQTHPLFSRADTYQAFLKQNSWVKTFLAHVSGKKTERSSPNRSKLAILLFVLEPLTRTIQLKTIAKHQTHEEVTETILAFHPQDKRQSILTKYAKTKVAYNNYYRDQ